MRKLVKLKVVNDAVSRAVAVAKWHSVASIPEGFIDLPSGVPENEIVGMWVVNGVWQKDCPLDNIRLAEALASGRIGVKFTAPLLDGSGYAEAGRNYVAALRTAGVSVTANSVSFESARSDYGRAGKLAQEVLDKKISYHINIIFLTPDHFPIYKEESCYNIGLFDWETDALPVEWVSACNQMAEIWVPCQWTADVCRKSGVTRPIHVFGHCASVDDFQDPVDPSLPEPFPDLFKFYSIFQWTERKNPKGLLRSYFSAFTSSDPVILLLKTYRCNYSFEETAAVVAEIEQVKEEFGRTDLPRIHLISNMLSREEILGLHTSGDCFVLIHRSEGWGLPIFEACMMGNPVITTNFSANLEFTNQENSYLVDTVPSRVFGMPWIHWYRDHMHWSDPDIGMCARLMRQVFNNQKEALKKGLKAQALVRAKFTWQTVGSAIRIRLLEIVKSCKS